MYYVVNVFILHSMYDRYEWESLFRLRELDLKFFVSENVEILLFILGFV